MDKKSKAAFDHHRAARENATKEKAGKFDKPHAAHDNADLRDVARKAAKNLSD
jgi:hypothetical protein